MTRDDEARVAEAYVDLRPLLFSIAYRMLGSVSEAEDIVQEAFVRYQRALAGGTDGRVAEGVPVGRRHPPRDRPPQVGPGPARDVRRRVAAGAARDRRRAPATRPGIAEQADSLSMSFLVLLERLTPVERAVFLLHDVFDYDFEEVARDRRAGRRRPAASTPSGRAAFIAENRPRFDASEAERDELVGRFFAAAEAATSTA